MKETQTQSPNQEDPLEEETATPSSILAWEILQRGASWATVHGVTTPSSILAWEILQRGASWATVHGVTKSQTQLGDWAAAE